MAGHQGIILLVGLLILAAIAYVYYYGTQASVAPTAGGSPAPAQAGGSPAPSPAAPVYTYVLKNQGGVWDPANAGDYTCAQTKVAGYCIVPDATTAMNLCNQDSKCVGYAVAGNGSGTVQLLAKMPVSNPSANGTFYQKTSA